jgi:hypothetical protein
MLMPHSIDTPAYAIADAVFDALGVWSFDLLLTPEKVVRAIKKRAQIERSRLVIKKRTISCDQ